jgi:ABC-2 type transport system permease protein
MLASLKSEFKKLLTVRSTYILTGIVLLLVLFLSVYVFGYKEAALKASSQFFIVDSIYTMLGTFVTFMTIIVMLLVVHEYRYNTISYTLTATNSRLKVLASKTLIALAYATVVGLVVVALAYFGTKLGVAIQGGTVAAQNIDLWNVIWRFAFYIWAYVLVGIIIAVLVRNALIAIVTFFMVPVVEQILMLLLKDNADFLPFRALDAIATPSFLGAAGSGLTPLTALGVSLVYISVLGVITTVLFVRRDAN